MKERVTTRPKDRPDGSAPVLLCWHKRRWRCREASCARQTFSETIAQVPRGAGHDPGCARRARTRSRKIAAAMRWRAHRVSWPTVQRAVDAPAAERLGEPAPTRILGLDETRSEAPPLDA